MLTRSSLGPYVTVVARINAANNPFVRMVLGKYPKYSARWEVIPVLDNLEGGKLAMFEELVSTIASKQTPVEARLMKPFKTQTGRRRAIYCEVESPELSSIYQEMRRSGLKPIDDGKVPLSPSLDGPLFGSSASSEYRPRISIMNRLVLKEANQTLEDVLELMRLCGDEPGTVRVEGLCLRQRTNFDDATQKDTFSPWKMFPFIGCQLEPPHTYPRGSFKAPDDSSVSDGASSDKSS